MPTTSPSSTRNVRQWGGPFSSIYHLNAIVIYHLAAATSTSYSSTVTPAAIHTALHACCRVPQRETAKPLGKLVGWGVECGAPMATDGEEEVLHELQAYLASICPAVLGLEGAESLQKALESPESAALLSS